MEIGRLLDLLEEAEVKMEKAYTWLAEQYPDDERAALVFARLAQDETGHANLVRFQRRIIRANRQERRSIDVEPSEYESFVTRVDTFFASHPKPSLNAALAFSIAMENSAAECHYRTCVASVNPLLAELVSNLGSADIKHRERLESFALSRDYRPGTV